MAVRYAMLLALALAAAGCGGGGEPRDRHPSLEGITLADLRPPAMESSQPTMLFMVTTYLIDEARLDAVQSCWSMLPQDAIRFLDKEAFDANGFFAVHGSGMMMGPVAGCLTRMGAEQVGYAALTLDMGVEMPFSEIWMEDETITYTASEDDSRTVTLRSGILGWAIAAGPDPIRPRRLHTRILPIFTPSGIAAWPGTEMLARRMAHRFNALRFDIAMHEADFILLGVNRDSIEDLTPLERLLFLQPGRGPKVRLYAIVCVKADN